MLYSWTLRYLFKKKQMYFTLYTDICLFFSNIFTQINVLSPLLTDVWFPKLASKQCFCVKMEDFLFVSVPIIPSVSSHSSCWVSIRLHLTGPLTVSLACRTESSWKFLKCFSKMMSWNPPIIQIGLWVHILGICICFKHYLKKSGPYVISMWLLV